MVFVRSEGERLSGEKGYAYLMLTMSDFAELTMAIVQDVGLENFVPMLIDPEQKTIRGLDEIPDGVDHHAAALEWVAALGLDSYCLAYVQGDEIRLRWCREGALEEAVLSLSTRGPVG